MKCPNCGGAELVHDTRDLPYIYKGESTSLPDITGDFCPACGEVVMNMEQSRHMHTLATAFIKEVNASIVAPDFIVSVRKKLDLNQQEAGQIFGGGVNAFSRYESGKAKPPVALIKLLKLLDHHPDLLEEIKA